MQVEKSGITRDQARLKAQKVLTKEVGNIPRLEEAEITEDNFKFPVVARVPKLIFDADYEEIEDVRLLSDNKIGEIVVERSSGEVSRTRLHEMNSKIRIQKKKMKEAVDRALVKSSASKFSKLPFSEHRFTPIQDLISMVLLEKEVDLEKIEEMKEEDKENYYKYLEILENLRLLRVTEGRIEADDVLIGIEDEGDKLSEKLELAMSHFFEKGIEHMDVIEQILGPYLEISSAYYFRSLELGSIPEIPEEKLREQIKDSYTKYEWKKKSFKTPRYLLQLEQVGILESSDGGKTWKGNDEVRKSIMTEDLEEISDVIA